MGRGQFEELVDDTRNERFYSRLGQELGVACRLEDNTGRVESDGTWQDRLAPRFAMTGRGIQLTQ